jgi:hypothetical protein
MQMVFNATITPPVQGRVKTKPVACFLAVCGLTLEMRYQILSQGKYRIGFCEIARERQKGANQTSELLTAGSFLDRLLNNRNQPLSKENPSRQSPTTIPFLKSANSRHSPPES